MNTFIKTLPIAALLLASCGSLQETTSVRDDVYDIPDRTVLASTAGAMTEEAAPAEQQQDPYYDERESQDQRRGDYYDMTYNDPYWYNYGRFGFNSGYGGGYGGYGSGFGMSMGYGWPTSWGGMSIGYSTGYYDPYWSNSWMSGYGMGYSPFGSPYGYGYGGYGYSPFGYGYNPYGYYGGGYWSPYQGPWGGCYGCYVPVDYGNGNGYVYGHRPSMTGQSGN
ncbi:MAG TPA: hypothetical protein VHL57_04660, partial [Flavobacteriales bacterium]|nr:hypothetical protein [Flavobacteriales bacterium]